MGKERLEIEVRMLRGSLEALACAREASSPTKMAAIASTAVKASRERVTISDAVEGLSLVRRFSEPFAETDPGSWPNGRPTFGRGR